MVLPFYMMRVVRGVGKGDCRGEEFSHESKSHQSIKLKMNPFSVANEGVKRSSDAKNN